MNLENGVIMTIDTNRYIIIDTIVHDNTKYLFTNEIKGEENLTEDYYIFRVNGEKVKIVKDEELISKLLPIFKEKMKATIMEKF